LKVAEYCFLMGGGVHLSLAHFAVLIYGTIINQAQLRNSYIFRLRTYPLGKIPTMHELISATLLNDPQKVRLLLNQKVHPDEKDKEHGETSLMLASEKGYFYITQLLLTAGANINARDNMGRTALMHAAVAGRTEVLQLLLDSGASINIKDQYGVTALMLAVESGNPEAIKALLTAKPEIDVADLNDETALTRAVGYGFAEIATILANSLP